MKDINSICIIGAGGHTRSLIALIRRATKYNIHSIYDTSKNSSKNEEILGIPVLNYLPAPNETQYIISSGFPKIRENLYKTYLKDTVKDNIIDPSVLILSSFEMGSANHLFAGVVINSEVEIGDDNLLNTACIIEHETRLGNHNHISVGSKICGRVKIGSNCFIGAGATVINNVSICDDVTVGAGAVVVHNITEPGTWAGVPAKPQKSVVRLL